MRGTAGGRTGPDDETPARTRGGRAWYGAAVLVVLIWLVAAGPLGSAMGRLSEVQTNDASAFLPVGAESTRVQEEREAFDDASSVPAIAVYSADGPMGPQSLAAIAEDAARISDEPWTGGDVVGPIPGTEDRSVAQIVVPVSESADTGEAVEELRALLADSALEGAEVQVTGPAGISADLSAAFGGIDGTLLAVALAAVLVILIAVYRSPLLPLVVITASLLALVLAAAAVGAAAGAGLVDLNGQSQGILFILVVGACTDYALLLVARQREALRSGADPVGAVRSAVRGTAAPILASGGTVILGVLCLLASDLSSNRGLGPVAALGIAAALVSALTFLPAALLLLGRAAFWPFAPRPDGAPGSPDAEAPLPSVLRAHPVWGRIAGVVERRPRALWVGTTLLLAAAAAFVPQFEAEGTSQLDVFRTEVEAVEGQRTLDRGFGAEAGAVPAVVTAEAGRADDVAAAAERVEGVTGVEALTDAAPAPPTGGGTGGQDSGRAPEQAEPRIEDGRVLLEVSLAAPTESSEAVDIVRDLRDEVHAVPGADARVGGTAAVTLDTLDTSERDLAVVIPLVLAVVLAVLVVLLRSVVAPVLLIATTVLSFGSALGAGALVFDHVLDLPGADPVVPLFAFVFLVALGIDYNIFLMTRAREEAVRHGHREGVLRALTLTGGVITSAGVVLAATFAALAVLPLLFLLQLAFLVSFGVLLDALLVRSLLVPALSLDVGRRMWWPSRLSRRTDGSGPQSPGERSEHPASSPPEHPQTDHGNRS